MSIDWYYARPELARGYLVEFERRGARALSMMAERGSGKTAFLQQDLGPIAAAHNRMPIYLDVWAVRNDPAVGIANQLKSAAQQLEHKDPRKRELTSVNISVLGVGGGMTAAHRPEPGEPTNELARINFWCDRLANIAGDKKVMLMLDEVQELATHPEGVDVAS
ncbi:MAG: hypothetical protein OR999_13800, partial [Arenicellales bacterium]|nr:hypothetical protein [Arenicellales bacterium]